MRIICLLSGQQTFHSPSDEDVKVPNFMLGQINYSILLLMVIFRTYHSRCRKLSVDAQLKLCVRTKTGVEGTVFFSEI